VPKPILYQFAISHFCEKVRWALDFKGVAYQRHSLVPGLHYKKARSLAPKQQLPILELVDGKAIQGSAAILDYLDLQFADRSLTPAESSLARQSRDWEQRIDDALGPAVRCVCYDTLLKHKALTISLLGEDTAWYGKPFLSLVYPRLVPKMRQMLNIEAEAVKKSRQLIEQIIDEMEKARGDSLFLVGGSFTRADVSAASMLAPLTLEPRYGVPWPQQMPEPLGGFSATLKPRLSWVDALYAEWRPTR